MNQARPGHRLQATDDGCPTLYSERYGQTLHSHRGALAEARHVFLEGAGVTGRFERGQATRVLEVGFGAGLNFLASADLALQAGAPLDYTGLEHDLLPTATLASLDYGRFLSSAGLFEALLEARAGLPEHPEPGTYDLRVAPGLRLELRLGEAREQVLPGGAYHAVYQDAFSPDVNPELWSAAFFAALYRGLEPGGRLSSYCVKGEVRRRLQVAGFDVHKRPGPPSGKREMLVAVRPRGRVSTTSGQRSQPQ